MTNLTIKKRLPLVLLLVTIFAILGAAPYFFGPGLTQPVAVGTFLNGNFPDVTISSQPYRPAFPNLTFDSPLTFADVPNSNVLVVGQRNGEIYWFENDETITSKNLMADLSDRVGMVWDGGFLGLAIHPEFGTPGKNYFYTYYTSKDGLGRDYPDAFLSGFGCYQEDYWGGFLYLRRYEVDPVTYELDVNSELTMIKLRMFSCTHRGGSMDFGTDGFLYLTTGEQSAYMKPQDISTNLDGGVLRLDVNQDPAVSHPPIRTMPGRFADEVSGVGYYIPNDNPFVDPSGGVFEEYYTLGHRNPHRMTKDKLTGIFYIGEVGEGTHEEINVVGPGKNYGWPIYEGYATGPGANCGTMYDNMPHEGPLVAFPRSEANAIIGGYVYRGSNMPDLYGKYICADYGTGEEIWAVDINTGQYELITAFSPTDIMSFGEDSQGELYLLSQGDNVFLYKMTQVNQSPHDLAPQLLSETGAFQDLETLDPSPGVIPYDLIESFWSDGAEKKRWLVIPNDGTHDTAQEKISFSENGDWEFPIGSVLIKHFEIPIDESNPTLKKRLETRFSIKASSGHFYFLTYKWNSQQTDAVLLNAGLEEDFQITTANGSVRTQTWSYPSTPDCISCHNPATKGTLGPRTRYLNSEITYPSTGLTANQLVTLSYLGILDEPIDDNTVLGYQTYKALDDPNATLDDKARSYLDLNCAYCHRPGGTGERAQFDLRLSNDLVQTGLMYAGTNTPLGIEGEKIVVGGDALKSILYHRTASVDPTLAMPPIAKNEVDQKGVDLIFEWINQLDPNYEDPTIYNSTYVVTNVGSGLVMDIAGVSEANFADVHQWTYVGGDNQKFIIESAGGIYYTLKAVHSNKNIDVQAQGQLPGTNVIQYDENSTDAQLFSFEYLGNDQYAIKSKANNLYLGIENDTLVHGGSIKTYENNGSDFFKWGFTDLLNEPVTGVTVTPESASVLIGGTETLTASVLPETAGEQGVIWSSGDETIAVVNSEGIVTGISQGSVTITATTVEGAFSDSSQINVYEGLSLDESIYTITNIGSGLVMDISGGSFDNEVNVIQWTSYLTDNQKYIVSPADGGDYTIKAVHSNKNVDVKYASQAPGTELIQYDENGTDAQLFTLEYLGNDMFAIKSKVNGLYLGIEDNLEDAGAKIVTNPNDNTDFFKWGFTDLSVKYTFDGADWSPSNPNGVSGPYDTIEIAVGDAVMSTSTTCKNIIVNPGASLTIDTGATVTTSSTTLKSTSFSYSSLILNGELLGEVEYELFTNIMGTAAGGGNDLIAAPLANVVFGPFAARNSNFAALGDIRAFAPYNTAAGAYQNYNIVDNAATVITSGIGFRAATIDASNLIIEGTVPLGQINVPISDAQAGNAWNLIGNPYPSYLDFDAFFNLNSDEFRPEEAYQAIYGYTGASATWTVWNLATIADPAINDLIAPGQGFFVKSKNGGGMVQFTEAMRRTGSSDDFIIGRPNKNVALSKLKLSSANNNVTTSIYFIEGTTKGLDPGYDAAVYSATRVDFSIFTKILDSDSSSDLAIQSLPYDDFNNVIVPLGIKAKAGVELSIGIDELSTLPSNIKVYIEDTENNTLTLLNDKAFKFTPVSDSDINGRFNIHYSAKTLSINALGSTDHLRVYTTAIPKKLYIKGQLSSTTTARLYDIHGRLMLSKVLDFSTTENTMDISTINTGVYFIQLTNQNKAITKKLVIK